MKMRTGSFFLAIMMLGLVENSAIDAADPEILPLPLPPSAGDSVPKLSDTAPVLVPVAAHDISVKADDKPTLPPSVSDNPIKSSDIPALLPVSGDNSMVKSSDNASSQPSSIDNKASELKLPGEVRSPEFPPLPVVSEVKPLADNTVAQADKKEVEPVKDKHKKKTRKKSKKSSTKVVTKATSSYAIKDRLPEEIYKKSYDNLNRHLPVAYYEKDYNSLLFVTAMHDDYNGLRSLLNQGRDINLVNEEGNTPLLVAVKNNAANAAVLLLKRHARRDVTDSNGMTPVQIASQMGNQQMVSILSSVSQ